MTMTYTQLYTYIHRCFNNNNNNNNKINKYNLKSHCIIYIKKKKKKKKTQTHHITPQKKPHQKPNKQTPPVYNCTNIHIYTHVHIHRYT